MIRNLRLPLIRIPVTIRQVAVQFLLKRISEGTRAYRRAIFDMHKIGLLLSGMMLLIVSCQPIRVPEEVAPQIEVAPQSLSGDGPGQFQAEWEGPAILHISIGKGSQPISVFVRNGLDNQLLVKGEGTSPIDEYRGYEFVSTSPADFVIEGNRSWKIQLLPVSARYFKSLHIPGVYHGNGNAVILMDGKHGVATFDTTQAQRLEAWAFGPNEVGAQLYINPEGDYKGKSVLPLGADWIIVSASGSWSVEIQAPCCEEIR
ncbi:MAG: hypothetical protein IH586_07770 [Anaerolineaceae bacterium]|nr:hypothetical protein [Anaerolineaceae bacterium]